MNEWLYETEDDDFFKGPYNYSGFSSGSEHVLVWGHVYFFLYQSVVGLYVSNFQPTLHQP